MSSPERPGPVSGELVAGGDLRLRLAADEPARVAFGENADWLGPLDLGIQGGSGPMQAHPIVRAASFAGSDDLGAFDGVDVETPAEDFALRATVRAYRQRSMLVFRLEAAAEIADLASGSFEHPAIAWPWLHPGARRPDGLPQSARGFGHQFCEFALPTWSDASLDRFFLLPHRPAVVVPLWILLADRCLLLAPLDHFHEQVIAVPRDPAERDLGVRCGWHGDLERVPAGFATELAIFAGRGPRELLEQWTAFLRRRAGTRRPSRYADAGVARLSYWTDNGAAYWYRTEPGCDVETTLERAATSLREQDVPVGAFQLDSWFYPHEKLRAIDESGGGIVPPTGMIAWEPREDALPGGIPALRRRLGGLPLILHTRHFSSRSPYFEEHDGWVDGDRAHPRGPELFDRLLAQAADWGAITVEQDWLVEAFLSVRGLRAEPGRARAWQEGLDRAAREHGLTLQWCMASPADFMQTVTLERVTSIRTSGDYRYLVGGGALWSWFLFTNAFARALGLHPYKDVFLSRREFPSRRDAASADGDAHAEAEALLAALSAGPVGIGDRAGATDRALVLRTCREDGVLVKPDVPIAALDRCFRESPFTRPAPLIGETYSRHPAGCWIYLACFNAYRGREQLEFRVALDELGELRPPGPVLRYDWRNGAVERIPPDGSFALSLAPLDWNLSVLCPLLEGELALFGDVSKYATAGDRRLRALRSIAGGGVELDALGRPGERVRISGWCSRGVASAADGAGTRGAEALTQAADGRFELETRIGRTGHRRVRIVVSP